MVDSVKNKKKLKLLNYFTYFCLFDPGLFLVNEKKEWCKIKNR